MKSIDSPNAKASWEDDILKDLSFIKENKRYKLSKRTLRPAGLSILLIVVLSRASFFLFLGNLSHSKNPYMSWVMYGLAGFLAIAILFQYYVTLKFDTIKNSYTVSENIDMLQRFLSTQHLAFSRHDKAPEVYMIISRNLNANPDKDYREIMVFIADDQQILVNSHFSGSKFSITPPSGNYKKMAKKLRNWLNNPINKSNNRDIAVQ